MDEAQAKKSLCKIFYRPDDGKTLLFGCGCVVKSSDQILRIATSPKILSLDRVEIFAKFQGQDAEIKLQFPTAEESSAEVEEIAYLLTDDTGLELPDGFSKAEIEDVDASLVPVFENLKKFGDENGMLSFYEVVRGEEKYSLQYQLGDNKRSLDSKRVIERYHLEVLGSPILSRDNYEFMGIVDFLEVENNESLLRIVYHDGIQRNLIIGGGSSQQRTLVAQVTDSGLNTLSPEDSLEMLWKISIDFRDEFSKVLDVTYSEIKYWPHLAEEFGIDKSTYDGFSTSNIISPTETMFEYFRATQPDFTIKELCESLDKTDAQEVCGIVKRSVEAQELREDDLVADMCDKVPKVLDTITLKLDREDRLWKSLAKARKIPRGKYSSFKTDRTDNPARRLFDALAAEGPDLTIENLKDKLIELNKNNLVKILNEAKISDEEPLRDLSKYPDTKSEIEQFLNDLKTDDLWNLASLYQQKDFLMEDIDLEKTFRQEEECHTPTKKMMEYVLASSPKRYTIKELIIKLKSIKREDCLRIIETYLKGGKDDIDKITRRLENLVAGCDRRKQPFPVGENVPRAPVLDSGKSDEEDNQYLLIRKGRADVGKY